MDQHSRRIIGFGIHPSDVDGVAVCRMFNHAISGSDPPRLLSSDNDPLVIATGVGWWLGQTSQANTMPLATAGVIVVAFAKVWVVAFQFMELRHAPRWLRHGFDAWIIGICGTLMVILLR